MNATLGSRYGAGEPEAVIIDPLLARLYHTRTQFEINDADVNETRRQLIDDMALVLESSDKNIEREMVADILISLLKKADRTMKCALSDRLSHLPQVPLRLVLQMVGETIDVAAPILKWSDAFNDLDLLYIIQSRDADYWRVIATREHITENVVDVLIDTDDLDTVVNVIDNKTATISSYALRGIEKMAAVNGIVAERAIARDDIPEDMVHKLYAYVGQSIERAIEKEFGVLPEQILENIRDVVDEFTTPANQSYLVPSSAMIRAADMFMAQGKLTPLLMLRTLSRGQVSSFVAQFAAYCGIPASLVLTMFSQKDRKGLIIAARSVGLSRQEFMTILTQTSRLPEKTALTSEDISAAMVTFDRVSERVALRLMKRLHH